MLTLQQVTDILGINDEHVRRAIHRSAKGVGWVVLGLATLGQIEQNSTLLSGVRSHGYGGLELASQFAIVTIGAAIALMLAAVPQIARTRAIVAIWLPIVVIAALTCLGFYAGANTRTTDAWATSIAWAHVVAWIPCVFAAAVVLEPNSPPR